MPTHVDIAVSHTNSPVFSAPLSVVFAVFTGICATSFTTLRFIHASKTSCDTSPRNLVAGRAFTCLRISSTCVALFALPNATKNGIRLDKSKAVPSVADILGYFTIKSDICCRYSSGTFPTIVPMSLPSHSVTLVTHVSGFIKGLATLSTSPAIPITPVHKARPAEALASRLVIHKLPSLLSVFCLSVNTSCASMIASLPVFAIARGRPTILSIIHF